MSSLYQRISDKCNEMDVSTKELLIRIAVNMTDAAIREAMTLTVNPIEDGQGGFINANYYSIYEGDLNKILDGDYLDWR